MKFKSDETIEEEIRLEVESSITEALEKDNLIEELCEVIRKFGEQIIVNKKEIQRFKKIAFQRAR